MVWIDFLLSFSLIVQISIVFVIAQTRQKFIPYIGELAMNLVIFGFLCFIAAQIIQLFTHFGWIYRWHDGALIGQAFGYVTFFFAILAAVKVSVKASYDFKRVQDRELWLRKVNENIQVAIFVIKNGEIVYKNHIFIQHQKKFKSENPFEDLDVDSGQKEIWLTTENAESNGFWVSQYLIKDLDCVAYIVTDITSAKLQGSFIRKIAKDLNQQHKNNLEEMTALIQKFLPDSVLYVGAYDEDTQAYAHVTHQGGRNISKSKFMFNETLLTKTGWNWFKVSAMRPQEIPIIVQQSEAETFGVMLLKGEKGEFLGVIFLILPGGLNQKNIGELFMDFLAIFSLRVKSDLEHKHDTRLLKQSTHQYRAIIESSNEAIVDLIIRPNFHLDDSIEMQWSGLKEHAQIAEVNSVFLSFFELDFSPTVLDFFAIKSIKHMLQYVLESGFSHEVIEVAHQKQDGSIAWLSCNAMVDMEDRRIRRLWLIIRDITDSKNHIQHLEHQAHHDKLTGLANRSALQDYLDEKIDQAKQFGFKMALLSIDLNRFKEVNEALGHHYGDVLLKKIEPRIRKTITDKRGFLARLSGDEFAVVIPTIQSENEITVLASEIMNRIKEPFDLGKLNVEVGCSIGIAFYPEHGGETSTLIRCSDIAMYQAKKDTSNILSYRTDMDENSPRRLALMVDMKKGLRNAEFFLTYQPKLNLATNEIYSAEALIRWQHPDLGMISPGEFIPLAEMSDVIINMTHWVIDQSLEQIKAWQSKGIEIKVSVNVSTRNLLDEDISEFIKSKIDEYDVPARLLEIEITESALMVDPERALNTLNRISEMGVSISVDDFGTGYSSFIYLRQLPINTLKVDIMFVRNMCVSHQDEIIVNSIINLAHNLSLNVVAEGAENFTTVERLKGMNCNYVQGYYISKPVLPDEFASLQQNWGK